VCVCVCVCSNIITNTLFTGNFIFLLMILKNEILKKMLVHITHTRARDIPDWTLTPSLDPDFEGHDL
jgi:hypothetical protein